MSSYRGTADRPDQAKAIAGVVLVHIALAAIILSGLNVRTVKQAVEQLTTINIIQPPPPPPVQPPPQPKPSAAKPEGAAAKKAEPTPVVAPEPKLPVPTSVPAAKVAGTGSATRSGAALTGNGTGAGGTGNGPGGGGDFTGFTPAQKITKIPDREYRHLADSGLAAGSVAITIRVNPDGSVSNCRVVRSSGNIAADSLMCQLTIEYVRFSPARDPAGRAIAQDVTFAPNWYRP
jgi:protein TonB